MLDQTQDRVEVFEKRRWTQDERVDVWQHPQALLLRVKAGNRASSFRQIRANTAQENDVPDTAVADGFRNRFTLPIPLVSEVRRLRIRRQECIDSSRVPKCAG